MQSDDVGCDHDFVEVRPFIVRCTRCGVVFDDRDWGY